MVGEVDNEQREREFHTTEEQGSHTQNDPAGAAAPSTRNREDCTHT